MKIQLVRRIALPKAYEFYEVKAELNENDDVRYAIEQLESIVYEIRQKTKNP